MENNDKIVYLSNEALAKFASAQGKSVEKVICHLWQNSTNKSDVVEIIDNVEIYFTDGQKLNISCNEEGNGLDSINFNLKETMSDLQEEFEGKIKIFALNASATKMWEDVIGKKLIAVQVTKENDYYRADSVLLNFGEEKRVIAINPLDGLIIDYHEED